MLDKLFKKKKESEKRPRESIVNEVLSFIFSKEELCMPICCPNIISEEHASKLSKQLPLVYIWNENLEMGSFTVSINSHVVRSLLEAFCKPSHEDFTSIKNEVLNALSITTKRAVVDACSIARAMPSKLFMLSKLS